MKRRHFLRAATASVLFPAALRQTLAGSTAMPAAASPPWDYVFFDERFERAQLIAAAGSGSRRPIAVQGDITAFWLSELDVIACDHPLRLRGVTTESIHFCLKILLGERVNLVVQASRLERNLLLWSMHTTPKSQYGTTPWPSL